MSKERALKAINLERTDRVPQIEYIFHTEYVKKISGVDPYEAPEKALAETYRKIDLDLIWYTYGGIIPETEKEVSHYEKTEWGWQGSTWRMSFPFKTVEEVLSYDPLKEQKKMSFARVKQLFAEDYGRVKEAYGNYVLVPGGYYTTLFMWPIMIFGLELFALAAASDPKRFAKVLEGFAEVSIRDITAWAQVDDDMRVFISHDDLAMSKGPLFNPDWLREYIFPWYPKIWRPLKDKGIKVLFCSDGNFTPLVDDLAEAGVDGFILEPTVDLKYIADNYGDSKVIIGNISTRVLTIGTEEEVIAEVKRCVDIAGHCPGFFFNATGGITHDIPLQNLETYITACHKYGRRE